MKLETIQWYLSNRVNSDSTKMSVGLFGILFTLVIAHVYIS